MGADPVLPRIVTTTGVVRYQPLAGSAGEVVAVAVGGGAIVSVNVVGGRALPARSIAWAGIAVGPGFVSWSVAVSPSTVWVTIACAPAAEYVIDLTPDPPTSVARRVT